MNKEEREIRAKNLLQNELFNEAFEVLKKELLGQWEQSGSQHTDQRESIWLAIRLLEKIKGHITSIVETGHMAKVLEKQHPYI
jgi:hypothetical protein|tara:strand:- start:1241 stop:1489 length:249 start_codon:yes stop_codon:yes gene_type:complete